MLELWIEEGLAGFAGLGMLLIILVLANPKLISDRSGKVLGFIAFFLLPATISIAGFILQMEHSKTTAFCLSCHEMQPYGKSLHIDDRDHIPAAHYQNKRILREGVCFTCHTTYTMFGDYTAKLQGLRHLYVHYFGQIPEKIKLYSPFKNRECLHCHGGARSFEENEDHRDSRADIESNASSCLECHDTVHDIENLDKAKMWKETSK